MGMGKGFTVDVLFLKVKTNSRSGRFTLGSTPPSMVSHWRRQRVEQGLWQQHQLNFKILKLWYHVNFIKGRFINGKIPKRKVIMENANLIFLLPFRIDFQLLYLIPKVNLELHPISNCIFYLKTNYLTK